MFYMKAFPLNLALIFYKCFHKGIIILYLYIYIIIPPVSKYNIVLMDLGFVLLLLDDDTVNF